MRYQVFVFSGLLLFGISLNNCAESSEREIFLLPTNFTGTAVVVFNQINGTPKEYEDGSRVYRIPKSGILYTQFEKPEGSLDQVIFFDRDKNRREELQTKFLPIQSTERFDSSKDYAMIGIDGKFGEQEFMYFFVGKPDSIDQLRESGYLLMQKVRESYPTQIK